MNIVKSASELGLLIKNILMKAGADQRNADRISEAMVLSNLSGVDTHGIQLLPGYINAIKSGEIAPDAWPEIVRETPTSVLIKGNWAMGHVTAKYAMDIAVGKARSQNLCVAGIVQCNHTGRLGEYAEIAAKNGMISMIWSGGFSEVAPVAVPFGGRKSVLSTNPIAFGIPAGNGKDIIIDYATTAISGVKITNARDKKEKLQPGCIVDRDGNPTIDPNDYFNGGAHVPFGGHKGYALMVAAEFLGRILTGSGSYTETGKGGIYSGHQGVTFFVCKADIFQTMADYSQQSEEMVDRIKEVPPATGFKEVLVPGDMERQARAIRKIEGIPVPEMIWQKITELAKSFDIEI